MNVQNAYAVLYPPEELKEDALIFFETKEELDVFISDLHEKRTKTNQRFSYFAKVFPKGSLYPADYDAFWKEKRTPHKKTSYGIGDYYIQRTLKSGKVKSKYYNFAEDFDWQLQEWEEKGGKDIYILYTGDAVSGDYYYERDIEKRWGEKDAPLFV